MKTLEEYNSDIESDPNNALNFELRGLLKLSIKDYQGAIQDFTRAIELSPQAITGYMFRGTGKESMQDYLGALEDYTKAIEVAPDNYNRYFSYNRRGIIKRNLKDYKGAIQDFEKVIEIKPDHNEARLNIENLKDTLQKEKRIDFKKPNVEDFSLTSKQVEFYEQIKEEENEYKAAILKLKEQSLVTLWFIILPIPILALIYYFNSNTVGWYIIMGLGGLIILLPQLQILREDINKWVHKTQPRKPNQDIANKIEPNYKTYKEALAQYENQVKSAKAEEERQLKIKRENEERRKKEEDRKQKEYWLKLDGWAFEVETGKLFEQCGFKTVTVTKGSGDGGIDIIMRKGVQKIIVQCKNQKSPATPKLLRELLEALHGIEKENLQLNMGLSIKAIFICTGGFTADAMEFALKNDMDLIGLEKLLKMVNTKAYSPLSRIELDDLISDKSFNKKEAYKRYLWWKGRYP